MASTTSPTWACAESASEIAGSPVRSIFKTATSVYLSVPTILAGYECLSGKFNLHVRGAFHHMVVREDVAVRAYHHARAETGLALGVGLLHLRHAAAEELTEHRIVKHAARHLLRLHYLG